ncbi:hypothetical protein SADUNF_Sadunf11G0121700 [Salix dunnii]|uniref:Uncharacterized protein n=1 Tax=Salix dunnii TaxID=1413687 RepID=A0A835JUE3_9ROSI|nr:hypothetical protein SADUNF_Sadunf11G0121700 [Salix dunnii]
MGVEEPRGWEEEEVKGFGMVEVVMGVRGMENLFNNLVVDSGANPGRKMHELQDAPPRGLVVILIGLSFGFGVFKNGFHKVKDHLDVCDPNAIGSLCGGGKASRPFLGFPAPPPGPF